MSSNIAGTSSSAAFVGAPAGQARLYTAHHPSHLDTTFAPDHGQPSTLHTTFSQSDGIAMQTQGTSYIPGAGEQCHQHCIWASQPGVCIPNQTCYCVINSSRGTCEAHLTLVYVRLNETHQARAVYHACFTS